MTTDKPDYVANLEPNRRMPCPRRSVNTLTNPSLRPDGQPWENSPKE
ncbi:hypothetical protein [Ciceribacter selenitireducens]|nr:hypothetical protein [Ciceribacter selenitireducens]